MPPEEVVRVLETDSAAGLTESEASRRLQRFGPNELAARGRPGWPALLLRQFQSVLIAVLVVAAGVSAVVGELVDAAAILAILVLNAALGFVQEYRANRTLAALREMSAPEASVVRQGELGRRPAAVLVPGDLVELNAGDAVPADGRLISGTGLRVAEAALTGESVPVTKSLEALATPTALADRTSMVYRGTLVVAGRGRFVVTATAGDTELGRVAHLVGSAADERTPLERGLDRTGRQLTGAALAAAILVFAMTAATGTELTDAFLIAVALAVAAVPEGLPAAITIVLALGVRRMAARHAVVRRLAAVETLGSTSIICSDKTGTLTRNELSVRDAGTAGGNRPTPEAARVAALAVEDVAGVVADPTDLALLAYGGSDGEAARRAEPVEVDHGFDAERKRSSVVRRRSNGVLTVYAKGAPESVVSVSSRVATPDGDEVLGDEWRARIDDAIARMASAGLRPIGLARRELAPSEAAADASMVERDLTLVTVVGMIDALRPEAVDAVRRAGEAGIRTIMITGDHPSTAAAIATDAGLDTRVAVLTGPELEEMDEATLDEAASRVDVYARVTSQDKLRIVRSLRRLGAVVAMTGDGVNDAPALRESHVGVAMGLRGTDAAREAADLVLTDDNYQTIVAAVEEGRSIVANIQRFLGYLVAGNAAEIIVVALAALTGNIALLPVQILWVNLVTDSLPALALGLEPPERDIMRRPPRPSNRSILTLAALPQIATSSALIAVPTLVAFGIGWQTGADEARNLAFATLVLAHVLTALTFRSATLPLPRLGILGNRTLVAAVGGALALQSLAFYLPPLSAVLSTSALDAGELALVLVLGLPALLVPEVVKVARPGGFAPSR